MIYQNMGDVTKATFRGKFVDLNAFVRKEEKLKINSQTYNSKN